MITVVAIRSAAAGLAAAASGGRRRHGITAVAVVD